MKPYDHFRYTTMEHGPLTGLLAVLPDVGVVMQRLPGSTVKRWGAVLHHDTRTIGTLKPVPLLGRAWSLHYAQDEVTHAPGTYQLAEAAHVPYSAVLAYGGGVDSFITWRLLGQPQAVHLAVDNLAQRNEHLMIKVVNARFATTHGIEILNEFPMRERESGWVPYRNLQIILSCAQISPDVVLARIAEWAPDKNPSFFRRTERLLASCRSGRFQQSDEPKVRIHTPVAHLTKTALVRRYLQVFGPGAVDDLMTCTWSCYGPGPLFCGKCNGCWSRWTAFQNNGINEEYRYEQIPRREDFTSRLHWRDFRVSMIPMYVKRAREMSR